MSSSTTASWRAVQPAEERERHVEQLRAARGAAARGGGGPRGDARRTTRARARGGGGTRARERAHARAGAGASPRGWRAPRTKDGCQILQTQKTRGQGQRAARHERLVLEQHGDLVDHDDEYEVEERLEPLDLLRGREPARRRARAAARGPPRRARRPPRTSSSSARSAPPRPAAWDATCVCAPAGRLGAQNRETRGKFLVRVRSSVKQFCGSGIGAARGWTVSTELLGIGFSSARCRGLDGLVVAQNSNVYPGPALNVHTHGGL